MLCEDCGYRLDGLAAQLACSECGTPIARSLPAARPGSPWQQRPSPRSFFSTAWLTLRRPGATLRTIAIDPASTRSLLHLHIALAAIGCTLAFESVAFLGHRWEWIVPGSVWTDLLAVLDEARPWQRAGFALILTWPALYALTAIEARGLSFFGTRRGWRTTGPVAWTVCAHAAVGWALAGLLAVLGAAAWSVFTLFPSLLGPRWTFSLRWLAWALPMAGAMTGFMIFESLAYLGALRCKFANPPGAGVPPASA
jgi:hypothetical protein